jgi:transposase-like protein
VRLVREKGQPVAQVARELGVNARTLRNWVNAGHSHQGDGNGASDEAGLGKLALVREEVPALATAPDAREGRAPLVPLTVVESPAPAVPSEVVESPAPAVPAVGSRGGAGQGDDMELEGSP